MKKQTTEYLILNEDILDWDALSADPDDYFSLVEIRLFRKRINWKLYFRTHCVSCPFDSQMLEIASKYFTPEIYSMLAVFGIADEDFIQNHMNDFNFQEVIPNCKLSEEFLMDNTDFWVNLENIEGLFRKNKNINLEDPQYSNVRLLLEIEK